MMDIRRVTAPSVGEPPEGTWSNCLVVGNQVFIAGMTARNQDFETVGEAGPYEQARMVFAKIKHLMEAAGGSMDDIVKLNIYVTDISRREEVWRARREFFTGDFPVSTLVEVSALALPEMEVEIEAVGFIGAGAK
jgi:2-iminobutanoate/2-iminopropanoate deaminase